MVSPTDVSPSCLVIPKIKCKGPFSKTCEPSFSCLARCKNPLWTIFHLSPTLSPLHSQLPWEHRRQTATSETGVKIRCSANVSTDWPRTSALGRKSLFYIPDTGERWVSVYTRADKFPELTEIRSKTLEAAAIETKLDNVVSARPMDSPRFRHVKFGPTSSNSAGEQTYPCPGSFWGKEEVIDSSTRRATDHSIWPRPSVYMAYRL